jgi:hypothetical protein
LVLDVVADWSLVILIIALTILRIVVEFFAFCKIMQGCLKACSFAEDPIDFSPSFFSFGH